MPVKLPPFTRNFYFATSAVFLVWMLLFDTNDMISQFKLWRQTVELEEQKKHYVKEVLKVKKEREELMGSPRLLEKFARERYLMKKNTEDVFVIVEEKE
ncbi:septum formation initiator family protein [Cytophagaceae bacterium BD1B2-1]|uniref:Septum formation initiator family protein n=2 Tax=Xanthocytophaga agilis TaxID=3048010 RepID=A0AAE3RB75_9BACT|nr:septum formation initiator family protein [Xanthocytophaga agilis]